MHMYAYTYALQMAESTYVLSMVYMGTRHTRASMQAFYSHDMSTTLRVKILPLIVLIVQYV